MVNSTFAVVGELAGLGRPKAEGLGEDLLEPPWAERGWCG